MELCLRLSTWLHLWHFVNIQLVVVVYLLNNVALRTYQRRARIMALLHSCLSREAATRSSLFLASYLVAKK